jgi:hypothetical protein
MAGWSITDLNNLDCITLIETFEDEWSRYFQYTFELTTPECRVDIHRRFSIANVFGKILAVKVWPEREPEAEGTLILLDNYDLSESVDMEANDLVTFRLSEQGEGITDFLYYKPAMSLEAECVTLIDNNHGNFATGFQQWVFKANEMTRNCTEDFTLYLKSDPTF